VTTAYDGPTKVEKTLELFESGDIVFMKNEENIKI